MRLRLMFVCSALLPLTLACKSEPKQEAKPDASASAAPKDAMDPALAKALADAKQGTQQNAKTDGPPPRGVFQPGQADKEAKAGAAPKVTVGSTGSEPRVRLTPSFGTSEAPAKARVIVALQSAPNQGPLPVQFDVDFTPKKGEGDAPTTVTGKVVAAGVPAELGAVPPNLVSTLSKLKGSTVEFQTFADGGATAFKSTAPKEVPNELSDIVRALSDAIAATVLPYPAEPIGVGGYWMAASRDGVMGVDMVTYRVIKVEAVQGDVATLSVNVKRYAASNEFAMDGVQGKFTLDELASGGEGKFAYHVGHSVPEAGDMKLLFAASLIPAGQPDQRGTLQLGSQVRFTSRSAKPGAQPSVPSLGAQPGAQQPAPQAPAPKQPAAPQTPPPQPPG